MSTELRSNAVAAAGQAPAAPALPARAATDAQRPLFWLAVALVVLSGCLVALALMQLRTQTLNAGQRLNESFARVVEEQTIHAVQSVDQRLQLVAAEFGRLEATGGLTTAAGAALLREQEQALPSVRAIWMLDAQGRVAHASDGRNIGLALADRDYFQRLRSEPRNHLYLGSPIRSRTTGKWLISVARPLRTAGGDFAGLVVAGLDPPHFDHLWQALDLDADSAVALFHRDGRLLMRSPFNDEAMGKSFADKPLFSQWLVAQPSGSVSGPSPIDGVPRLNSYRSVATQPGLVVLVARASHAVLAPWRQQVLLAGTIWAAAVVVSALLFLTLGRALQQRQRATAEMLLSSQRLSLATDAAVIGVWDWDVRRDIWRASATYYAMLGQAPRPSEVGTEHSARRLDSVHPDDRYAVRARVQAVLDGADLPYEYEARLRHADGSLRWLEVTGRVVARDDTGKPTDLMGVRIDITERKQAEAALRASEARFRTSFDSAGVGMALNDIAGRYLQVNPRLCEIIGYAPEELLRMSFQDITHPADLPTNMVHQQTLLDGSAPFFQFEKRYIHRQGHVVWVNVTVSGVRDPSGRLLHFVCHIEDISARKALEQALLLSQARLEATLNAIPDLMFEVGLDGRYHDYHSPHTELLAAPPEVFLGKFLTDVLPADAAATAMAALRQAHETGFSGGFQIALDLPQGRHWFELSVARKATPGPDGSRFIVLSRDITVRQRAQAELQSSLLEKEALLKEVHHRVKNNLQIIHSLLRLETGRHAVPATRSVLKDMQARIRAMALLHESLYRSGTFAAVDLGAYLRQLAAQTLRTLETRPGAVRLELDLASVQVSLDQATPCGLLVNELLANSLKHGFPDGHSGVVRLTLRNLPGAAGLELCVSDTGVGLPADFDLRRGQSLGLQLVADLAEQLGGRLTVGPWPQARFCVTFTPGHAATEEQGMCD